VYESDDILYDPFTYVKTFSSIKYDKDGNKIGEYTKNTKHDNLFDSWLLESKYKPCVSLEQAAEKAFKAQAAPTPTIEGNTIKFTGRTITFEGTAVINDDGTVSVTSKDGKCTIKYDKSGAIISITDNPDYSLGDSSVYLAPSSTSTENEDGSVTVTAQSGCTTTLDSDGNVTDATDMYGESLNDSALATDGQLRNLAGLTIRDSEPVILPSASILFQLQRNVASSFKVPA